MKNNFQKYFFLATILFGFFGMAKNSQAATYYVDYASGADTNNGTATVTAWKHCPGDASATNNANITLTAGDTVIFKGGVIYTGTGTTTLMTVNQTGTDGNTITYDGNSAGTFGTGKAAINLDNTYYTAFLASAKNYITLKNFDIYGAANDTTGTHGMIDATGVTHFSVQNSIFHEVTGWDTLCAQGSDGGVTATTQSIRFRPSSSNLEVSGCEFYAIGETGIDLYGVDTINIHDNDFGGVDQTTKKGYFSVAIRVEGSSSTCDNVLIKNNKFHDGWQYEGDDAAQRCHAGDWIHVYGTSGHPIGTVTYDGNFFYNDKVFDYAHGSAFSQLESYVTTLNAWNNLFVNAHAGHGGISTDQVTTINFFNNTTVQFPLTNDITAGHSLQGFTNLNHSNNIYIDLQASNSSYCNYDALSSVPTTTDHNVYYTPGSGAVWKFGSNYYTLAQWKTASGKETYSVSTNPNLVSLPATGATSSSGDYRLSASMPGANLSSSFATDYAGNSRSAWDIGAYEYVSGGDIIAPSAPQGLSVS